ncbi:MAG: hypothetical protein BroJett040_23670 [Oligoflexia bacterium]|nr:MAG: hypothetical protein BroJett040_23670 [Oligoflexia bacterium]
MTHGNIITQSGFAVDQRQVKEIDLRFRRQLLSAYKSLVQHGWVIFFGFFAFAMSSYFKVLVF